MKIKLIPAGALIITGLFSVIVSTGFKPLYQPKPWVVPDKDKNTKNPIASNAESIAAGKALWSMHCASCHGKTGAGDGSKAAQLKTQPPDFTAGEIKNQTDGALFFKTSEGRGDMPSFKKKISDPDDIWSLVVYMRTIQK